MEHRAPLVSVTLTSHRSRFQGFARWTAKRLANNLRTAAFSEYPSVVNRHPEGLKRVANLGQDAERDTKGEIIYATIYHLAR